MGVLVASGVGVKVEVLVGVGGTGVLVKVGMGVRVALGVDTCATGVLVAQAKIVRINKPGSQILTCKQRRQSLVK
jgi:hypothetical protein